MRNLLCPGEQNSKKHNSGDVMSVRTKDKGRRKAGVFNVEALQDMEQEFQEAGRKLLGLNFDGRRDDNDNDHYRRAGDDEADYRRRREYDEDDEYYDERDRGGRSEQRREWMDSYPTRNRSQDRRKEESDWRDDDDDEDSEEEQRGRYEEKRRGNSRNEEEEWHRAGPPRAKTHDLESYGGIDPFAAFDAGEKHGRGGTETGRDNPYRRSHYGGYSHKSLDDEDGPSRDRDSEWHTLSTEDDDDHPRDSGRYRPFYDDSSLPPTSHSYTAYSVPVRSSPELSPANNHPDDPRSRSSSVSWRNLGKAKDKLVLFFFPLLVEKTSNRTSD